MRRDFQLNLVLFDCSAVKRETDVQRVVHHLAENGFLPAEGAVPNLSIAPDIDQRVHASYRQWEPWDAQQPFKWFQQSYAFSLITKAQERLISGFSCKFFGPEHCVVEINALVGPGYADQSSEIEALAQKLRRLVEEAVQGAASRLRLCGRELRQQHIRQRSREASTQNHQLGQCLWSLLHTEIRQGIPLGPAGL